MARKRKRPAEDRPFRDEILGLVLLATGVFLTIALASYRASDPNAFDLASSGAPSNWGGHVGATVAAVCYQLFGIGAWLGPVVLAWAGKRKVLRQAIDSVPSKLLGVGLLLISGPALLAMGVGELRLGGTDLSAGGVVGAWTAEGLNGAFGPLGGPLVAVTVAVLATVMATRLSLERALQAAWHGIRESLRRARTGLARRREQRRKARERRAVVGKHAARSRQAAGATAGNGRDGPLVKLKVPVTLSRPDAEVPGESLPVKKAPARPEPAPEPAPPEPSEPDPLPFEQPAGPDGSYALPEPHLLDAPSEREAVTEEEFMEKARAIADKGAEFKVTGEVVAIHPGPVVTTYEFKPAPGVKYSRIINLEDDLSLALKAESIRIARIPGKSTVGIEAPNSKREVIRLREIVESKEYENPRSKLTLGIGKDIHGEVVVTDLARMPHLLIAGTTGSGKSVALNAMLLSLLFRATPDEVKLVMVDPKRLEFGLYEDIPHLLTPVVVEAEKAAHALSWAVREMERRYKQLAEYGVRNIEQFNLMLRRGEEEIARARRGEPAEDEEELKPLPYIVVVIDELADLMIFASNVVETAITRLSQMARAVGIHLIIATQRPSVDVITGTIKNNLPSRISFRVASKVDSRVILDTHGAENLLGKGDMLFLAPGTSRLQRVHGAYVDEREVRRTVEFWQRQARPQYEEDVTKAPPEEKDTPAPGETDAPPEEQDEYYADALKLVLAAGEASISNIQRRLRLGYARAGRIVDMMEDEGIVGPPQGSKPRELIVDNATLEQRIDRAVE